MSTIAITEAITTLAEAQQRFNLHRTEDEEFFSEWRLDLPDITDTEKTGLNQLRQRYLYQRSEGHLLEGIVMLLLVSPLLGIAGFYDPPFKVRAEESVQITIDDSEDILQGRIDVLVLNHQIWVVVLESKKTALSVWAGLPQNLAYLMANPQPEKPSFGMMTNGDDILFVKLTQMEERQYNVSRVFSPFISDGELYNVLQVLKSIIHHTQSPE
ncbi:MAG TPA: type I restriction endonuclease subunit R [Cyanobacteria bacterium UBA11149]|nr:type I restriction endonuclease subunit R [Cyanobacteria bacterium UBA11367]HBE60397.1 type I restriction endonuclease subunit R [Cyanobacteria bacterium UBA11366]HBK66328.1 type I restriction endonuclease subunit R [Cyanobacteria bacterium UBA11166]HBR73793.1 type I restriction endonuclease subunit R [Cyanobacteria bacterium UBA11159]HBS71366.1 type I restriction endonuclease subunit R [Cyanobacteria bacterium UBA11153]HBW89968.1 type I restriction endonuclease subunit R [Cyanobacteria bac